MKWRFTIPVINANAGAKAIYNRYKQVEQVETFRPGQPRTQTHNAPSSCSVPVALRRGIV